MKTRSGSRVRLGFEEASVRLPIAAILPLREVQERIRRSVKYRQIEASIAEIGLVEPPVVMRDSEWPDRYHLLDGHLRIEILRERGETDVVCLIAKDDEAFTYNKRVSRIAMVQEHKMIITALNKGVSEERLAKALNVNIAQIKLKRNLLVGICPEVAELLRDKFVPATVFGQLRCLKPMRQIEVAQLMIAMNRYSRGYAKSLVAASSDSQFVTKGRPRPRGLSVDQINLMQRESENLDRKFRQIEQSYGKDHLDLVLAVGYVGHLLSSARIVRYLAQHHAGILSEFQKVADFQKSREGGHDETLSRLAASP